MALPKASLAAKAARGAWRIETSKNPITGEVSASVQSSSRRAMYNGYEFEKVTLDIDCSHGKNPYLGFFGDKLLTLQATSGDDYLAPVKIDDEVVPMTWSISNDGGVMVDDDAEVDLILQKLQTGKTLILSYRGLSSGEQFATFDLTGIRTAMNRIGCPIFTSE